MKTKRSLMLKFLLTSALRSVFRAAEASDNTPERKGARGERRVHNALTSVLNEKDYQVLSDLILPLEGGTTQLDHVVVSRFGIFVIETKHMSGWIFGGTYQKQWTQVQKGGNRRGFQNPIRQNYAHVKAVQGILKIDEKILHNFVVFTGTAKPKTDMPYGVAWGLKDLGKLIALQKQQALSEAQVHAYGSKLRNHALENTRAIRKKHVENLGKKASAKTPALTAKPAGPADSKSCPRCGDQMAKRTNRKTGDAFWGCTGFPKCRGTRKMA